MQLAHSMGSLETNLDNRIDASPDADKLENGKRLAKLKGQYSERVDASKIGKAAKEICLKWLKEDQNDKGQPITIEDLELMLREFAKSEEASVRLCEHYREKVKDFIERGILAPLTKDGLNRLDAELKWFADLPFEDREAAIDKKRALLKSDIDDQRRIEAAENFDRLPKVFRRKHQKEWDKMSLEERLAFVQKNLNRHEELKTRFLALPPEIQDKHRKIFKAEDDFDKRELLLLKAEAELTEKRAEQKEQPEATGEKQKKPMNKFKHSPSRNQPKSREHGAKAWLLGFIRKLTISSRTDTASVIEPFAISAEIVKRRRRLEIQHQIRDQEKLQQTEEAKDVDRDPFKKVVSIQTRRMQYQHGERHQIKAALKPELGNQNAVVARAKLLSEDGRELTTEEFQQTELRKQRGKIEKMAVREASTIQKEFDQQTLNDAAANITDEEMKEAASLAIRKAA